MGPLSWVRRITDALPEISTIPLFGNAPPFDWEKFSASLSKHLQVPNLSIHTDGQEWKKGSEIKKGLSTRVLTIPINLAPLGTVFWMMPQDDAGKFASWMMRPDSKTRVLSNDGLQEGFYRYLLLEALECAQHAADLKGLSLHISEDEEEFDKAFCIDIEIRVDTKRSVWGRLAIPDAFRKKWISHFSSRSSEYISSEIGKSTWLSLGVQVGSLALDQGEWDGLKKGDFVLLDRAQKGHGILMLQSTPLFSVEIAHQKIKLADYALYYEENMASKEKEGPIALKDLPLTVTVEIARLKMTLDQLVHLTPGSSLELPVEPDSGVTLSIEGKKVGRAELVYVGEQLGLRILEIG